MADATFNGTTLRIALPPGQTAVDVREELYTAWKEFLLADFPVNGAFPPAFSTEGGTTTVVGEASGRNYFLRNDLGWRIIPPEEDIEIVLSGNLFKTDQDLDMILPTVGGFNVLTTIQRSSLSLIEFTPSSSALVDADLLAIDKAVHIDVRDGSDLAAGTNAAPVKTVAAARVIADANGLKEYHFRGAITLDSDHDRWTFVGDSSGFFDEVACAGFSVDEAKFEGCKIQGVTDNSQIEAFQCELDELSGAYGFFRECVLLNNFYVDNDTAIRSYIFDRCISGVAGPGRPHLDFTSLPTTDEQAHSVHFRAYSGGLNLRNMDVAHTLSLDLISGTVGFDASCAEGTVVLRGTGEHNGDPGPNFLLIDNMVHGSDTKFSRKALRNKRVLDPVTGREYLLSDDGTFVEYDRAVFEDAQENQVYREASEQIEVVERYEETTG